MSDTNRCMLDFLQNIFGVPTDLEVFRQSFAEQLGSDESGGCVQTDYRMFTSPNPTEEERILPTYVRASYNMHAGEWAK